MSRTAQANIQVLLDQYLAAESLASKGLQFLGQVMNGKRKRHSNLARLLRHHDEEEISDEETHIRDQIDFLLGVVSRLEVAYLTGAISGPLPRRTSGQLKRVLSDSSIRDYYEVAYPVLLPQLFRRRLGGSAIVTTEKSPVLVAAFTMFMEITDALEVEKGPVEAFLWLIDSGERYGYTLEDVLKTLKNQKKLVAALASQEDSDPDSIRVDQIATIGFFDFVEACIPLYELLEAVEPYPIAQSAMWHTHGYWFDNMSNILGGRLWQSLSVVQDWQNESGNESAASHDCTTVIDAFRKLTSGRYAWALRELVH